MDRVKRALGLAIAASLVTSLTLARYTLAALQSSWERSEFDPGRHLLWWIHKRSYSGAGSKLISTQWQWDLAYSGIHITIVCLVFGFFLGLWLVSVLIMRPHVLRMVREQEERERLAGNRCSQCGYDLTGNTSGVCPECGTAIPHVPPETKS